MNKIFKLLILIANVSYVIWFFEPYNIPAIYDQSTLDALTWNGYGSNQILLNYVSWVLMVLFPISALGLWLFISEARFLYFSLVVFSLISTPFGGLSVQSGIDSMLSYISSLLDGIILYMAFFSPVSHQFKSVKSLKWKYNVSSTDLPAIDEHSLIYQLLAVIKTYKIASWCFALFIGFLFRYSYGFAKDAIWSKRNLSFMSWPIDPFSESQLLFLQ